MSNDKIKSLEEKLKVLRAELKKEILKVVEEGVSSLLIETLAQFDITGEVAVITWDFEEESDDEGGIVWYPYNIKLAVDGEDVGADERYVSRLSRYGSLYEYYLDEDLNDIINSFKGQLIDLGVNETLTIHIGGQK